MSKLLEQLQLLVGQMSTLKDTFDQVINIKAFDEGDSDIGGSQMNELLLVAGFDRVTPDFFALLCNGTPEEYKGGTRIHGLEDLALKVNCFRKLAILRYGNVKFAFKRWSNMNREQLKRELSDLLPRDKGIDHYSSRTAPLEKIEEIPLKDGFLLGHITGAQKNASMSMKERRERVRKLGEGNFRRYLTFDHMDVYIATSMRRYRDFLSVGKFIKGVFSHQSISELKLRYFDPTQTYSADRFCQGLLESLMLKRAKCAIYCAQETDTFGKDSELAVTLAQGKPVLAYVPEITDLNLKKYQDELIQDSKDENPDNPIEPLKDTFISSFPEQARSKLELFQTGDEEMIASELAKLFQQRFEERAKTLHSVHPLAMQVELETGVANGILLVRSTDACVKVLRKVLLRELEFDLEEQPPIYPDYACGDYRMTYILREKITKSPFRIVIGDALLTNSFWNFYLKKTSE